METCVVGCKLPHGLNVDYVIKKGDPRNGVPAELERQVINGANSSRVLGGYGVTRGVDKEKFEKWMKEHASMDFVRNGSLFMVNNDASAIDAARERAGSKVLTGLEPIDPMANKSVTPEDAKVLAAQRSANPDKNRVIDELDAA